MPTMFIPLKTHLTEIEYQIVRRYEEQKGWGAEGIPTALKLIIREWDLLRGKPISECPADPDPLDAQVK